MNEVEKSRAKALGELLDKARRYRLRSVEDCADVAGLPAADYEKVESGQNLLALPSLEALAIFLDVPMAYFWGTYQLTDIRQTDFEQFLFIRQRIVGTLLQQSREEAGKSAEELAQIGGISEEQLALYESGAESIPIFTLERMGKSIGLNLEFFLDENQGPLAQHEKLQKIKTRFEELTDELQQFVVEPINIGYLETAVKLSKMDVKALRGIAENLLDITF